MPNDPTTFFSAVISAGAMLSGFCGTFMAFRIQREANYYRQPAVEVKQQQGRDTLVNLTHFTSALLLLILATLASVGFGFLLPLFALAGALRAQQLIPLVVAGLVVALVLVLGYFLDELVHYHVFKFLLNDANEWRREAPVVVGSFVLAAAAALLVYSAF